MNERKDDRAVHGMLRELARVDSKMDEGFVADVMSGLNQSKRSPRPLRFVILSAAALIVLGVFVLMYHDSSPNRTTPTQVAVVDSSAEVLRDGRRLALKPRDLVLSGDSVFGKTTLTMTEGSVVKLDADAQLRLDRPTDGIRAKLTLVSGRSFFRVSKEPGRFLVDAGAVVEVKGTVFGVSREASKAEVHVLEGKVSVSNEGSSLDLERGQSSSVPAGEKPALSTGNPGVALLWARDWTQFKSKPLSEVFAWIEANSQYQLDAPPEAIAGKTVTISIANESAEKIVEQICISCGLDWEIQDATIRIFTWE